MVNRSVIISIGPVISDSFGASVGLSDDGPMAGAVFSRVSGFGGGNVGLAGGLAEGFATALSPCDSGFDADAEWLVSYSWPSLVVPRVSGNATGVDEEMAPVSPAACS